MSNEVAVHFVSQKVAEGFALPEICEQIMQACLATTSDLASLGCDNMTIIIVALLNGKSMSEWVAAIKTRVGLNEDVDKKRVILRESSTLIDENINDGQGVN
jgi:protein phosphatase 2C family protein 2/3